MLLNISTYNIIVFFSTTYYDFQAAKFKYYLLNLMEGRQTNRHTVKLTVVDYIMSFSEILFKWT